MVVLVCGMPATGKTTFASWLAGVYSVPHFDLEVFPGGWPLPAFKPIWDRSPHEFVRILRREHNGAVLDWGFPPRCLPTISLLAAEEVSILWLSAPVLFARRSFIRRGTGNISDFDTQIAAIQASHLPDALPLKSHVSEAIDSRGQFVEHVLLARRLGLPSPSA
jgi:hypothetical protein